MKAKIDLEKFICSLMKRFYKIHNIDPLTTKCWLDKVLEDQGLEYRDGEIVEIPQESEDERIRKSIIAIINNYVDNSNTFKSKMIAWLEKQGNVNALIQEAAEKSYTEGMRVERKHWLEKQGEQKISVADFKAKDWYVSKVDGKIHNIYHSVDKVEPKFKVGDWVVSPNGVYWHIDAIQNGRYEVTADTGQCGNWPLDTNIYRLWTIQDAKDGNVLTNGDFPCIFKRCDDNGSLYVYCGINAHNDFSILSEDPENVWDDYSKQYFPATKEQRDLLFQKMHEAGYEWDEEEKKLKETDNEEVNGEDYGIDGLWHAQRILEKTLGSVDGYQTDDGILSHQCAITAVKKLYEQKPKRMISAEAKEALYDKPDWSEKDENVLEDIEEAIINYWHGDTQDILLDWLKSLKDKYTWKPSDEQMKQLVWIAEQNKDNMIGKELISLYQDLKKLREG